jgi:hypothetical protein
VCGMRLERSVQKVPSPGLEVEARKSWRSRSGDPTGACRSIPYAFFSHPPLAYLFSLSGLEDYRGMSSPPYATSRPVCLKRLLMQHMRANDSQEMRFLSALRSRRHTFGRDGIPCTAS